MDVGDLGATGRIQRMYEKAAVRRSHETAQRFPAYAQRKREEIESKAMHLSLAVHCPRDQVWLRAAASRKAEAEKWIAEVRARKARTK